MEQPVPTRENAAASSSGLSDHFDGRRFYNPTLPERFSPDLSMVFRMIREKRTPWPNLVENQGVSRLYETLWPGDFAVTFVNHATFLIQTSQFNILTDPVWSQRVGPFGWVGAKRVRKPGVALDDLPTIDLVLVSHNHYDHMDIKTLKYLRRRFEPMILVAAGDKARVRSMGFRNVRELDWWESAPISPDSAVTFAPTQHSSARSLFDRDKSLWGSFMFQTGRRRIYFGGDAGYSSHYSEIQRRLGSPDLALLGIGAYEPRWFMKCLHMNPAEAVRAHKDLGARQSIGMHFGTFKLSAGSEAFRQPQEDLKRAIAEAALPAGDFITLEEGETRLYRAARQRVAS